MDVNDILYQQTLLAEEISKILTNYKKDGPARRTAHLIKKRLETLEERWCEYKVNHAKLTELLTKEDDYFVGGYYEQVKERYLETKQYIEKTSITSSSMQEDYEHPSATETSQEVLQHRSRPQEKYVSEDDIQEAKRTSDQDWNVTQNTTSSGNNSKLDEMYKKQLSHFKAFSRTVSNINVEIMQEKWEFEDSLKALQARWKAIDLLHWELDSELDGSNKQYEARFTEHEQQYHDVKKAINSKLWSVSHREKSTPVLEIPIFNNQYQQWTSFKDLFSEAIHNNPSLSNAQKMQFLKSKLRGERLIQHLPISTENYITSWEILNQRYNNKKLIFTTHINTMLNLPVTQQANASHFKRLHDVTTECLNAIKNLGVDISTWDPILVHLLVQKLDSDTHGDYHESLKEPRELPNLHEFLKFLENKFTTMESARRKQENYLQKQSPSSSQNKPERSFNMRHYSSNKAIITQSNSRNKLKCPVCYSIEHGIYFCKQFLEMSPTQKRQTIAKLNYCLNCLNNHNGKPCMSIKRCRECNECHNTILHAAYSNNNTSTSDMNTRPNWESNRRYERSHNNTHVAQQYDSTEILLPTALIKVQRADGGYEVMRVLVDQASQVSLITAKAAQILNIPQRKCKGIITGVGTKDNTCTGVINISCFSMTEDFNFETEVYIMKSLTRNLPNSSFSNPSWEILDKINLADPEFYTSKPIDILLGADIYATIILDGIYRSSNMTPVVQETRLGWILCGKMPTLQCNVVLNNIEEIQRYWDIEDIPQTESYTSEDAKCIDFYKSTTTRLDDGRYKVRLPLTSSIDQLGQSKYKAIAQFRQLEQKFKKNANIKRIFTNFINEYQALRHIKLAVNNRNTKPECYLPYHCVLREDSSTTRHRVVFNASQRSSTGLSLNDCMLKGPNLQKDIFTLILGWRQYQVAFIADIEKMFLQIWLHEDDQALQKIVWRNDSQKSIQDYQLTTVTFGTKSAPFLAMMTLRQLASDEREHYPEAAEIVENYFYMDDLVHGAHSLTSALQIKQDLTNLLKSGGFNLRKWNSNYPELLQESTENTDEQIFYKFKLTHPTKTLGLHWNPEQDIFTFQCKINVQDKQDTKRSLLSAISQQYDPLGYLTPLSTKMKLLFQQVWKSKMAWDDQLPEDIHQEWKIIKQDILQINKIQIPRWLGTGPHDTLEIHGFSDSSLKAYACVVYSKIIKSGQAEIKILAGKSRLVPSNKQISLPRLELMGALLLSKVIAKIKQSLSPYLEIKIYGWVDSTAVLGWLQGNPDRWKQFVSNRVCQIVQVIPSDCWQYVPSSENPADCASRGLTASKLIEHPLWLKGPKWLSSCEIVKQNQVVYTTQEEEKVPKQVNLTTLHHEPNLVEELINKYSSFSKLVRVLAWIYRFITKTEDREKAPWLTLSELRKIRLIIVKQVQDQEFYQEKLNLRENKQISSKSKILKLNPFLDDDEILRVGGRLQNAHISPEMKNPIILPQNHRITELIINEAHILTYHGGARITLALTRQKYWIPSGNRTTKKYLHKCVTCKIQKPVMHKQIMGDLPEARVNPSRPFQHTGLDFSGHVFLKTNKGRGVKTTKGYVAVFVCMATKAVHLELVSDLTTSSFIAALRRLSARRGTPSDIYCDNGRNFVGASRVLQEEYQEILLYFLSSGPLLTIIPTERDMRTRWHLTQQIFQDIWKRWRTEYLSQITARAKWQQPKENIKINDVVLVHEENLPPGKWIMGRVTQLHPGQDGFVRVVTLKTASGYMKRPVIKLSKLTSQENEPTNDTAPYSDTASKATNTRKIKKSFFTTMIITFVMFMSCIARSEGSVNITKFRENQGLYFDKLSNMLLIKDEWKLVVYYQMEPYGQGNKALISYIETLDKACDAIRKQTQCDALVIQLRHGHTELEYYNQLLLNQQLGERPARRRLRRGLINGIGYIANSLFGVLDDRFADQYKKDIQLLQENEKHILNLWKNQTTIVESENNLLKRTESTMNQQCKIINQHIMTLDNAIQDLQNSAQANRISNDFALGSIIASNVLNNLRNLQNNLLETITDIYHGRFNLHLMTPEQLIVELSIISSKLPKDVSLPIENIHSDISKLINLIKVKTRMLQDYLLFELRIPLISRETYEIFKIIPIPKQIGNKTIKIVPVSDYVAMNIKKDTFVPMTEIDVKGCFIQENFYCHSQKPEYQMRGDRNLCAQHINQECKSTQSLCENTWKSSYITNTYIYTCCKICNIRTLCDDQITAHQLTGTGSISIGHGCIIKAEDFTIYPHKPHTSEVQMSPNLYLPTISPINNIINISIPHINISDATHGEIQQEAAAIQTKIRELKDSQVSIESVSYHDIHHYTMIYSFVGIATLIAIVIAIKRSQCSCRIIRRQQSNLQETGQQPAAPTACSTHAIEMPDSLRHTTRAQNKSTSPVLQKFNEIFKDQSV